MKRACVAFLLVLAVMLAQFGWHAENSMASAAAEIVEGEEELNERDGSKIESIKIHWLTRDSTTDNEGNATPDAELQDMDHLYLATRSDSPLEMRYQLEVALSGQYNYAPGDIQITIPAQVWNSRTGELVGDLDLSVPAYPSTKADFNWQLVNGKYVLTNTRTIGATDKSMFQFSIMNLVPHTIVDMSECEVQARCEVVTNKGNLIALNSNVITAQIDTWEAINYTNKTGTLYESPGGIPNRLLKNLPEEDNDPDHYIYVNWVSWVNYGGNQPFSLKVDDMLDEAYEVEGYDEDHKKILKKVTDGIFLGCTNYQGEPAGATVDFEAEIVKEIYNQPSSSFMYPVYFWSAYKKSAFKVPKANEAEVLYEMYNDVTWTLTEMDPTVPDPKFDKPEDEQKVTTVSSHALVPYAPIQWQRPVGDFSTDKWTEYEPYKDYTYGYALNRLQRGENVDMNFIIRTFGKGYEYTLDRQHIGATDAKLDELTEDDYGRTGWKQITEDFQTFFNFESVPLTSRDFQFKSLRVSTPTKHRWTKLSNGSWGYQYDSTLPTPDLIIEYQVDGDEDKGTWRHAATAVWGTDGTGAMAFQDVATGDGVTVAGSTVYFPENTTDVRHIFTSNVFNGQRPARCEIAQIEWYVYPTITMKASDAVKSIVKDLFAGSDAPTTKFKNDVRMDVYGYVTPTEEDRLFNVYDFDYSRATLSGAGYGVSIDKNVSFNNWSIDNGGDNDVENHRVILHYSAVVEEQSNLKDRVFYDEAVSQNVIPADTKCVWYDLLPERVEPLMDTIRVRADDNITAKYVIPNFRDTNRTMLVVEVDLQPQPIGTQIGFVDKPAIYFDAVFTWDDIDDLGGKLVNYIAYESKTESLRGDTLGTFDREKGEPDTPALRENQSTPSMPDDIVKALTDLDPTTDAKRFLYSKAENEVKINVTALSGIAKKVSSDLVGQWTQGLRTDTEQVTVYEGHTYTYRLRVKSADTTKTSKIVVYDTIENYHIPDPASDDTHDPTKAEDYADKESKKDWYGKWKGQGQWRGELEWVDLSELIGLRIAPRLYYSDVPNLTFADSTPDMTHEEKLQLFSGGYYKLQDNEAWKEVTPDANGIWKVPDDVNVTAIAIDATTTIDGKPFVLEPGDSFIAYLHMRAPDDNSIPDPWAAKGAYAHKLDDKGNPLPEVDWEKAIDPQNNMYAFNNTRLKCVQENQDGGGTSSDVMIRNDYTRVGIVPGIVRVTKEWHDQNNHDALRPDSVTVTLMRKVAGSGLEPQPVLDAEGNKITAVLNEENNWSHVFYQVDIVDEKGDQYIYSFAEADVPGYTSETQMIDASNYKLINTHPNAKVKVSGLKTWNDNDNAQGLRPETVTLRLYRDGVLLKTTTIRVGRDGVTWRYNFGELDKYAEGGHEYTYTVEEEYVPKYVMEGQHWDALTNTYSPYGDLEIIKTLQDATEAAREKEFTFTLMLFEERAAGADLNVPPTPLEGKFAYTVYQLKEDGKTWAALRTGTIATRDTFTLKGGQKLVVEDLPSEATYEVTEDSLKGFTLVSSDGSKGTIQAGRTQTAEFVNRYAAKQKLQLTAKKTLTGHKLRKNQFRFTLTDITNGEPGKEVSFAVTNNPQTTTGGNGTEIVSVATANFGEISYTQADDKKTYRYRVAEVNDGKQGYTYDTTQYTIKVTLADNGDGTMAITAVREDTNADVLGGAGDALPFKNAYKAEGELSLKAWKVLEVRDLKDQEFTFELYEYDTVNKEKGKLIDEAKNDPNGNVVFKALTFDQDDVSLDEDNPAKYTYLAREKHEKDGTVIYSDLEYIFTITVYDNNDGTLSFAQDNQVGKREYNTCEKCKGTGQLKSESSEIKKNVNILERPGNFKYALKNFGVYRDLFCTMCNGLSYINNKICEKCKGCGLNVGGYYKYTGGGSEYTFIEIRTDMDDDERAWMVMDGTNGKFIIRSIPSGLIESGLAASDCDLCNGTGKTEGKMDITGAATIPVFTNKLKDGALSVTKLVNDNPHPLQEFTFHVQLTGENVPKEMKYEVTKVETSTAAAAAVVSDAPEQAKPKATPFHATAEQLKGDAYAVLRKSDGEFVFFRAEKDNLVDPYGNTFEAFSGDISAGQDYVYFKVDENKSDIVHTWYWPWTKSSSPYTSLIKHVRMEGAIKPKTCAWLFTWAGNLKSIDLSLLDTSEARSFYCMFYACSDATEIDVSGFDTSKATNFYHMFTFTPIKSVDVSGFDTSNATTMEGMFWRCRNLESLDVSNFNTGKVTNMHSMFSEMSKLKNLDLSNFDTSSVTNMAEMFDGCEALENLDIGSFDTSNAENMTEMFYSCQNLKSLDLSNFDTSKVKYMTSMFAKCDGLEALDISSFDLSNVTSAWSMLSENKGLKKIVVGSNTKLPNTAGKHSLPSVSTKAPYTGQWRNTATEDKLTSAEMLGDRCDEGTWVWDTYTYNIQYDTNGGAGADPRTTKAHVDEEAVIVPGYYRYGYKLSGFTDGNGHEYEIGSDGTITIPAGTYGKDENVTLTAVWKPTDTDVTLDNGSFTFTLLGNETATFKDLPAGISYKVWEDTPAGWVLVQQVNQNGVIEPLQTSAAAFTNEYNPDKASIYLSALKLRDGKPPVYTYKFTLSELKDDQTTLLQTKPNIKGGAVNFDPIEYGKDDVGTTHTYIIAETEDVADTTVACDPTQYKATVTVADDSKGNLTASVVYQKLGDPDKGEPDGPALDVPPTFHNYTKPGNLQLVKLLAGQLTDKARDQEFEFVVTFTDAKFAPWTGSPKLNNVPQTLDGNGSLVVKVKGGETNAVLLTDIPAGITYTVREVQQLPGWTMDANTVTGSIPANDSTSATLTNTYKTEGQVVLEIAKALIGRQPKNEEFTFELKDADGNVIATTTNDTNGVVRFDELTFTEEVTNKQYTISEVRGTDDTVEYSEEVVTALVTMTDKEGEGRLTPTVTYSVNGKAGNTITNKVKPGSLSITKTVDGKETDAAFEFMLILTADGQLVNGEYSTLIGETVGTLTVTDGRATFALHDGETIIITGLADGMSYSVIETNRPGYTASAKDNTGVIVAGQKKDAEFVNTYRAAGAYSLTAAKTLEGAEMREGQFTFVLKDANDRELQTATNSADGTVAFAPLTFDQDDIGVQHYTVSEVNTSVAGFTYDKTVYHVTLTITDNDDGTLNVVPKVQTGEGEDAADVDAITFQNKYSTYVAITATKEWIGDEEHPQNRYPITITLYQQSGGGERKEVSSKTIPAGASGEELTVTWENMPLYVLGADDQPVEVVYSVEEKMDVPEGEKNPYTTIVTGDVGSGFKVINRYSEVLVQPRAKKVLDGRALEAGMFEFVLKDGAGNVVDSKRNLGADRNGVVVFEPLVYTPADLADEEWDADKGIRQKTLAYTLEEVAGSNLGFKYDNKKYDLTVTLTETTDGELTADLTMTLAGEPVTEAVFTNTFVTTGFEVKKEWVDSDGGFITLTLYANGVVVSPQPEYVRDGNTYRYTGLPKYDEDGKPIVYSAKEQFMDGFMTVYKNEPPYENESDMVYDGGTIINRAVTGIRVRKVWSGLEEGENPPKIVLKLYCNGELMERKTPEPDRNGWYYFRNLPKTYKGQPAVYTVVEEPVNGFRTSYMQYNGEDLGYVMDGGTITNYRVPKTGDQARIGLWLTMAALAVLGMALLARKRVGER